MGKPLAVDWHEVRTLALAIGGAEAARQTGVSWEALKRRATREGWYDARKAAKAALGPAERKQLLADAHGLSLADVPFVPSAAEVLSRTGPDTRAKLAITVNKTATHLSGLSGAALIDKDVSTVVLQNTKAGSVLHGWQEQALVGGVMVNVNLLGLSLEQAPVIDLPTE